MTIGGQQNENKYEAKHVLYRDGIYYYEQELIVGKGNSYHLNCIAI